MKKAVLIIVLAVVVAVGGGIAAITLLGGNEQGSTTTTSATTTTTTASSTTTSSCTHSFSEWSVQTQPTCSAEGLQVRTCNLCQEQDTEPVAKLPHTEVVDEAVPKTCTTPGKTEGKHCFVCETVIVAQEPIPAGHTEVIDEAVAKTCTTPGKTEGKHCSVCETVIVAQEPIPAGHTEVIDPAKEATCTQTGLTEGKHCSACETVIIAQQTVPLKAHTDDDGDRVCDECNRPTYSEGLEYSLYRSSYTVEGIGTCTDTNVIIPSVYNDLPVIAIGIGAFGNCTNIESITIPESVLGINRNAFMGCTSLKTITIPASVTYIGEAVFRGCSSLESITVPFVGYKDVIGNQSTQYPFGYFFGTSSYAGGVATTQWSYGSDSKAIVYYIPTTLKSVTVTGGEIARGVFLNCTNLESITIPESVTSIGIGAFYGCTSLLSIDIPNSVTSIGSSAFEGCTSLKSIEIPASVTSIDAWMFKDCTSLESITIPDSVVSIGSGAFEDCTSLESITISDSVVSIGQGAFGRCSGLESITIPFVGASIAGTRDVHFGYIFGAIYPSDNRKHVPANLKSVTITGGTSIGLKAFQDCTSLESITIPASVTSIGTSAFKGCTSLENIAIPTSVTSIGSNVFDGCKFIQKADGIYYVDEWVVDADTSITSANLRSGTVGIASYAFYNCTSLESITIPPSLVFSNTYAFAGCTSLSNIYISDIAAWCKINLGTSEANPLYYANNLYLNENLLTDVEIPQGVTSIGSGVFYGYEHLKSITIPASVTSIGTSAFKNCRNLVRVNITNIAAWCGIAFGDVEANPLYYTSNLYLNGNLVANLEIPQGVTSIGAYAFYNGTNFESVTIPDSVTSIGTYAFRNCSSLARVNITDIAVWCGIAFSNTESNPLCWGKNLYVNGTLVTNLEIPDGVTSIGTFVFYNCTSLTSVTIPPSVSSIGEGAFKSCSNIESMTIPFVGASKDGTTNTKFGYIFGAPDHEDQGRWVSKNLRSVTVTGGTRIATNAFYHCSKITSITLPASVTSIDNRAFNGCTSLAGVTFENPNGWWRTSNKTATSGTSISASDLANASTAATYLKSTYVDYYWKRT